MSFTSLGLSDPILKAVAKQGYETPSPIQAQAIPVVLEGRDLMAAAQTGTGKTAGFTLPLLEILSRTEPSHNKGNQVRALVLTPTRELAAQVGESVVKYGRDLKLRSTVVFGGVKINPQMKALRGGVDILVATPGRLLDLIGQNAVKLQHLEVLVLDEADRMLDMGFITDIRKIMNLMPKQRQNLMFSATFSPEIRNLAKGLLNNPAEISVSAPNTTVTSVEQWIIPVDKKRKSSLLDNLIKENEWHQVLVFSRTRHGADKLARFLGQQNIKAAAIHGDKSQGARTKALSDFKKGKVQVLVATDIAARGLDINQLPQVVNFDLPDTPEDYVHRIGRTGRAGASGVAISLVAADEDTKLFALERLIGKNLERRLVDGFEPIHDLPDSPPASRPHKPRKPSRRKPANGGKSAYQGKPGGKTGNQGGKKYSAKQGDKRAGASADKRHTDQKRTDQKPRQQKSGDQKPRTGSTPNFQAGVRKRKASA